MPSPQGKTYTCDDYYSLPDDTRAELIDGQIYYMAPPSRVHQELLTSILNKIYNYISGKGGPCKVYPAPFAVKLSENNHTIVEPDISVICDKNKLDSKGCNGAPDVIIEIVSPSNQSHDYVKKLNLYQVYGVREYWIVDPIRGTVMVYFFEENNFNVKQYTFNDKIKVNIYEDLYIDFNEVGVQFD